MLKKNFEDPLVTTKNYEGFAIENCLKIQYGEDDGKHIDDTPDTVFNITSKEREIYTWQKHLYKQKKLSEIVEKSDNYALKRRLVLLQGAKW